MDRFEVLWMGWMQNFLANWSCYSGVVLVELAAGGGLVGGLWSCGVWSVGGNCGAGDRITLIQVVVDLAEAVARVELFQLVVV